MNSEHKTKTAYETVCDWLEAFNNAQWGKFKSMLHPEILFTQRATGDVNRNNNHVCSSFHHWHAEHIHLLGSVMDGFGNKNRAVLEVLWKGTKVDGETVDFYACLLFKVQNGKIIEIVDYY